MSVTVAYLLLLAVLSAAGAYTAFLVVRYRRRDAGFTRREQVLLTVAMDRETGAQRGSHTGSQTRAVEWVED